MIHSITIDGDIDERLKEFNAKLPSNEFIVDFKPHDKVLFILTETKLKSSNNLLLEEFMARKGKREQ